MKRILMLLVLSLSFTAGCATLRKAQDVRDCVEQSATYANLKTKYEALEAEYEDVKAKYEALQVLQGE